MGRPKLGPMVVTTVWRQDDDRPDYTRISFRVPGYKRITVRVPHDPAEHADGISIKAEESPSTLARRLKREGKAS